MIWSVALSRIRVDWVVFRQGYEFSAAYQTVNLTGKGSMEGNRQKRQMKTGDNAYWESLIP